MPAASKLSPYEQQIRAWRAQSWDYAEVSAALKKHFDLTIDRTAIGKFCRRRGIKIGDERFHPSLTNPGQVELPTTSEIPQKEAADNPAIEEEELSASDQIRRRIKKESAEKDRQRKKGYSREEMDEMLAAERERKRKEMRGE